MLLPSIDDTENWRNMLRSLYTMDAHMIRSKTLVPSKIATGTFPSPESNINKLGPIQKEQGTKMG